MAVKKEVREKEAAAREGAAKSSGYKWRITYPNTGGKGKVVEYKLNNVTMTQRMVELSRRVGPGTKITVERIDG